MKNTKIYNEKYKDIQFDVIEINKSWTYVKSVMWELLGTEVFVYCCRN